MNKQQIAASLVFTDHNKPWTDSRLIADKFGKRHKNVIQAIQKLECSAEFSGLNFKPAEYIDEQGKARPMYRISQDGFLFLATGFTGKAAAQWKEKFIAAFRQLERELARIAANRDAPAWLEMRQQGKSVRRIETDVIAEFIGYARAQGSQHADHYFQHFSNLTRRIFSNRIAAGSMNWRDTLDSGQLLRLQIVDERIAELIREGMANNQAYKLIFERCKLATTELAFALGYARECAA